MVGRPLALCAVFSGVINLLMLTGSLFMLQVYDRVLSSGSLETLQALLLLAGGLYVFLAALELVRSLIFSRLGQTIEASLREPVFVTWVRSALPTSQPSAGVGALRDLEQVRNFFSSGGPSAVFDLPWTPLFVILLFVLHPLVGVFGLFGVAVLATITWSADKATAPHQKAQAAAASEAQRLAEATRQNAETAAPLGMIPRLYALWRQKNEAAGTLAMKGADVTARAGSISRFFRHVLQSGVLALGAYLTIEGEATGGVMIASSILLGRALAPVELAIVHWRSFVAARQAMARLDKDLPQGAAQSETPNVALPRPARSLSVEGMTVAAPGGGPILLQGLNWTLEAGDCLGVIGPSGSGKSTLARALVGAWPVSRGSVRLDGATFDQWPQDVLGQFVGYLPQRVELFTGTVGQNIARFQDPADSDATLRAADQAGLGAYVRGLDGGFDAAVGADGGMISAGQRQRIGLARALYQDPFLLVLDEPNSALDAEGEAALTEAILAHRRRGGVAVVIAHRPSALQAANKALVIADGRQKAFGARDEILKRVLTPVASEPVPGQRAEAMA